MLGLPSKNVIVTKCKGVIFFNYINYSSNLKKINGVYMKFLGKKPSIEKI